MLFSLWTMPTTHGCPYYTVLLYCTILTGLYKLTLYLHSVIQCQNIMRFINVSQPKNFIVFISLDAKCRREVRVKCLSFHKFPIHNKIMVYYLKIFTYFSVGICTPNDRNFFDSALLSFSGFSVISWMLPAPPTTS